MVSVELVKLLWPPLPHEPDSADLQSPATARIPSRGMNPRYRANPFPPLPHESFRVGPSSRTTRSKPPVGVGVF